MVIYAKVDTHVLVEEETECATEEPNNLLLFINAKNQFSGKAQFSFLSHFYTKNLVYQQTT